MRPDKIRGLQLPPLYPISQLLACRAKKIDWRVKELTLLLDYPSDVPSLRRLIFWGKVRCAPPGCSFCR
ncbi:unnamed protein product [Sphenostylis stenocarpa]|uniref:Uncharacterized protein n=1 Tax=Sphenostylis stenocarpa TaxID=92480 RepID=A0AA86SLM9_9FABA|nr:unnamed protein product [Sphenostylis stenocarpa]